MSKKKKSPKIKPPKTCGQVHKTKCTKHNDPCNIPVEFDPKDSRTKWVAALHALGAQSHTKDDKHRCAKCENEQINHSPWRFLRVPGTQNLPSAQDGEDIRRHLEEMGWDV